MSRNLEREIRQLMEAVNVLSEAVSSQAGQMEAMRAALLGALVVKDNDLVASRIDRELQRCRSLNGIYAVDPLYLRGFEQTAELIGIAAGLQRPGSPERG